MTASDFLAPDLLQVAEVEMRRVARGERALWAAMVEWLATRDFPNGRVTERPDWAGWEKAAHAALYRLLHGWEDAVKAGNPPPPDKEAAMRAHREGLRALRLHLWRHVNLNRHLVVEQAVAA